MQLNESVSCKPADVLEQKDDNALFTICHFQDACFLRRWNPLLVAGGGGGAGQCSPGMDAQLAEYGVNT